VLSFSVVSKFSANIVHIIHRPGGGRLRARKRGGAKVREAIRYIIICVHVGGIY
jgi:hypothetical protein